LKGTSSLWIVCLSTGAVTSASMRPSFSSSEACLSATKAAFPLSLEAFPGTISNVSSQQFTTLMLFGENCPLFRTCV
jgi:hypothetical protein